MVDSTDNIIELDDCYLDLDWYFDGWKEVKNDTDEIVGFCYCPYIPKIYLKKIVDFETIKYYKYNCNRGRGSKDGQDGNCDVPRLHHEYIGMWPHN